MKHTPPTRKLREHPALDQLKRQAKELLVSFRAGESAAAAEVSAHYHSADPASFALHDAQLVLARSYGVDSWPKLKAYVDGVTVARLTATVRADDIAQVRRMLKARPELANMEMAENDEHRALHYAVFNRSPEMVRLLMEYGADARKGIYPYRDATRALTIATERGYDEIAAIILEAEKRRGDARAATAKQRATAAEPQFAEQPVLRAVAEGDASWLRARHAEGKLSDCAAGPGLLAHAVKHNRPEILKLLLDLGFDPDKRVRVADLEEVIYSRGRPLQLCAESGQLAMARLLLDRGADPNGEIYAAGTPVSTAYRARDEVMLKLLLDHGGIIQAATAGYHRDTELARRMLADEAAGRLPQGTVPAGSSVAEQLLDGDCGEPEIVRMALERIDWPRDDSRWYGVLRGPLAFWNHIPWIASEKWPFDRSTYLTCFRLILERCHANVGGSFGRTILHDVVAMRRREGVRDWISEDEVVAFATVLLDDGARLDVRDELLKSTPLGWACRWGRAKLVKLMLERGADPVEADAEPWARPRTWARKMGHEAVLAALGESA